MLTSAGDYRTLYDSFQWEVPEYYNIGVDICDKWAHQPDRLALIYESDNGLTQRYTFSNLKQRSNRLANGLRELGIENDRPNEVGSGISLGHPIGCTGARQMVSGMNLMQRKNYSTGLISMCIGGGMGMAMVIEK